MMHSHCFSFQSTLPARGATMERFDTAVRTAISIHAPREGSDRAVGYDFDGISAISIHAPREGSDNQCLPLQTQTHNFNPRSPRGERPTSFVLPYARFYFNPRSPRGERHDTALYRVLDHLISIHAPREGSDMRPMICRINSSQFQSTLPARGATPLRGHSRAFC